MTAQPAPSPPPTPTGNAARDDLATRAMTCYRATPCESDHLDAAWRARAARAVRSLSATLGVDPVHIVATPDPDRVYGLLAVPEIRLVITDPGTAQRYDFIPELGTTAPFILLTPCPGCARLVPTHRVATLADLGRYLACPGAPDADQYPSDPAHEPGCRRRRSDLRYGTAHHPAPGRPAQHSHATSRPA
jgi:hypothetical protein